ncbi:hypothetical protein LTR95_010367, partial [Oleoguttula sp. CCFEE 5521]
IATIAPMNPTANSPTMSIPSLAAPPVAEFAVLEALGAAPVALGPAKPLVGPAAVEESVADAVPPVADALVASVLDMLLSEADVVSVPEDEAELALSVALEVAEVPNAVDDAVDDAVEESDAEDEVEITRSHVSVVQTSCYLRDAPTNCLSRVLAHAFESAQRSLRIISAVLRYVARDCVRAGAD